MGYDDRAKRKARRNLRVTGAVTAAIDHIWEVARSKTKHALQSALMYWFDTVAEDYEAEVASLQSALDAKVKENRRLRAKLGMASSGTYAKQSDFGEEITRPDIPSKISGGDS